MQKKTGELEKTETERSVGQPTHKHQSCLGLHHLLNRRTQRKTESTDEERANTVERERSEKMKEPIKVKKKRAERRKTRGTPRGKQRRRK
jgi:hypothetical protein